MFGKTQLNSRATVVTYLIIVSTLDGNFYWNKKPVETHIVFFSVLLALCQLSLAMCYM